MQIASLALCLLAGCYSHAGDIVRLIGDQVSNIIIITIISIIIIIIRR